MKIQSLLVLALVVFVALFSAVTADAVADSNKQFLKCKDFLTGGEPQKFMMCLTRFGCPDKILERPASDDMDKMMHWEEEAEAARQRQEAMLASLHGDVPSYC
eukprot:Colp12_sorted_trinity150504_noHs@22475